jgi:hypothetical protein
MCTCISFRTFTCTYMSFRISIFNYTRLPVFMLVYIGVKSFNTYLQIFLSFYLFRCAYTLRGFRIDVIFFSNFRMYFYNHVHRLLCTEISCDSVRGNFLVANVARHGSKWNCEPLSTAAEFHPLNFIILHLISQLTSLYVTQVHKRLQQSHVAISFCFCTISVTFLWVKKSDKSF